MASTAWAAAYALRAQSLRLALLGDSLALGAHWNYSPDELRAKFPGDGIGELLSPAVAAMAGVHEGKGAGENTHYGDQTLWLLMLNAPLAQWPASWRAHVEAAPTPGFYRDHATKDTLATNAGSTTTEDLGGASRLVALAITSPTAEDFVRDSALQAIATHNNPLVLNASTFFAQLFLRRLEAPKEPLADSVGRVLSTTPWPEDFVKLVGKGLEMSSSTAPDAEAVKLVGELKVFGPTKSIHTSLACPSSCSLPVTVFLLIKYQAAGVERALVANTMLGGDQAARGLLIGLILGPSASGVPEKWWSAYKASGLVDAEIKKHAPAGSETC